MHTHTHTKCPRCGGCLRQAIKCATARSHPSLLIASLQTLYCIPKQHTSDQNQRHPTAVCLDYTAAKGWTHTDTHYEIQIKDEKHTCAHSAPPLFLLLGILRAVMMLWHYFIVCVSVHACVCLCKTISVPWRE